MKIYTAAGGNWTSYGSLPIDPTPDVATQYPSTGQFPGWANYPGTGATT